MDTAKTTDLAARVCPRCGEAAGQQRFCGGCGLNLSEQLELPTRSEWETVHAKSGEATRKIPVFEKLGMEHLSYRARVFVVTVLVVVVVAVAVGLVHKATTSSRCPQLSSQQCSELYKGLEEEGFSK
jgi:ribosomal protein S27AE